MRSDASWKLCINDLEEMSAYKRMRRAQVENDASSLRRSQEISTEERESHVHRPKYILSPARSIQPQLVSLTHPFSLPRPPTF